MIERIAAAQTLDESRVVRIALIGDIAFDDSHTTLVDKAPIRRRASEHRYVRSAREQRVDDVASDESRAARHEHAPPLHRRRFRAHAAGRKDAIGRS